RGAERGGARALVPRGRPLPAAHLLELQPLLAKPRGLRLLAGVEQRALRLGDLRRARFALRRPGLGGVEVVATQQERFRLAAREPARRKLAEPRVLADPVEVLPQRIGELPQRPRQPRPFVAANKLQAAQRGGKVGVGDRLVDDGQQALRKRERALALPHATAGLY